jgi:hypothetical protein
LNCLSIGTESHPFEIGTPPGAGASEVSRVEDGMTLAEAHAMPKPMRSEWTGNILRYVGRICEYDSDEKNQKGEG